MLVKRRYELPYNTQTTHTLWKRFFADENEMQTEPTSAISEMGWEEPTLLLSSPWCVITASGSVLIWKLCILTCGPIKTQRFAPPPRADRRGLNKGQQSRQWLFQLSPADKTRQCPLIGHRETPGSSLAFGTLLPASGLQRQQDAFPFSFL